MNDRAYQGVDEVMAVLMSETAGGVRINAVNGIVHVGFDIDGAPQVAVGASLYGALHTALGMVLDRRPQLPNG